MATALDDVPPPQALGVDGGWALRRIAEPSRFPRSATYAATRGRGPEILLRLHRVSRHPLRACYPFGAHDLALELVSWDPAPSGHAAVSALLRELAPALFASDPDCRRIVAAPDERDTRTQNILEAGGFRLVTEADLPDASVVLFTAEPPGVAGVSTALDDMPHESGPTSGR